MPEMPEVQAHAERLTEEYAGAVLDRFRPLAFTALKTATPRPRRRPGAIPLIEVGRRGKHLLLRFEPVTFVVHLMQGGRLKEDQKQAAKPRGGQARWAFADGRALLLTEAGTERKAGVWVVAGDPDGQPPLDHLGPEADTLDRARWAACWPSTACGCTAGCATSASWPASAGGWPTRSATGPSCRPSPTPASSTPRRSTGCTPPWASASPSRWPTSAPGRRHVVLRGPARHRPPPGGRGLPGVRRHHPGGRVPQLHGQLLPDLPDRRQGAGRQHHQPLPQVALRRRPQSLGASAHGAHRARRPARPPRRRCGPG